MIFSNSLIVFWLSLFVFLVWLVQTIDLLLGISDGIPPLSSIPIREDEKFPKISVIFAARNESAEISQAIASFLAQDYPDFEIVAVNDRSTDQTLSIMQSFSNNPRLKILNVTELPHGWLGKTHALYEGYCASNGEILLFTDADVVFTPKVLKTAAMAMNSKNADHLVVFPKIVTGGFIERSFVQVFGMALFRKFRPWDTSNPKSSAHLGLGAFNMIRRDAYEKIGTHQELALQVVDDITLGLLVKEEGLRQQVMSGVDLISVRWVANAGGVIKSLEKNAFAGAEYKISILLLISLASILLDILPFGLLFFTQGLAFCFNLGTLICLILISRAVARKTSGDWKIFWTHPFASMLLLYIFWRSAFLILRSGGVRWRDTFYSLDELRIKK